MSLDEIDREILRVLSATISGHHDAQEIKLLSKNLPDPSIIHDHLVLMKDRGLVAETHNGRFRITANGVDLVKRQPSVEEARKILLKELYDQYFENPNVVLTQKDLSRLTGMPEGMIFAILLDWQKQSFVSGVFLAEIDEPAYIWRIERSGITAYETKYMSAKEVEKIEIKNPLLKHKFQDEFYQKLIDEINRAYYFELYVATWVLVRKLFENLIITLLRAKFQAPDFSTYYIESEGRFHDFAILIKNLKSKTNDLKPYTTQLDEPFFTFLEQFRDKANSMTHSIDVTAVKHKINELKDKINDYCDLLALVYKNITNNQL